MKTREELIEAAQRLWPNDPRQQARWLRAVRLVRRTKSGWIAERRVERLSPGFMEN